MSLRLRINLLVGALTLLFVGALLALRLGDLRASVAEEVTAANRVATQLLGLAARGAAAQGPAELQALLRGIGRVRANEVTLHDAAGREIYHSPPSPYKAGRSAPGWFERAVSPRPVVGSIELPAGRLEVRADASRAALDAWDAMAAFLAASAALLVLVNLLVLWLVGRATRPFARIVEALGELERGRFDVSLPPLGGGEAAAIGAAFNRTVGMLRHNLDNERRAALAERELSGSRELARWVDHHLEQERRLIARELHDELGQSVTAMRSMALSIAQRVGPHDAASAQAARLIADESSRLYDAMHGLIPRLAPLVLDALGLAEALDELARRTRASHAGVEVDLAVDLGAARLSSDAALALYRAAQEGITNALRHGGARRIMLRLQALPGGGAGLDLVDDGSGMAAGAPAGRQGHHGLRWLAERVGALGGTLEVGPAGPRGVRLQVRLPASAAEAGEAGETDTGEGG